MSDLHVSLDELDRWLADQHRELLNDITATIDVEAGLSEVLLLSGYDDLVADLDRSLDVEAGLAAIVPVRGAPRQPAVPSPHRFIRLAGPRNHSRGNVRALVMAAALVIGLAVATSAVWMIHATDGSQLTGTAPIAAATELDILHYEVSPPSGNGTVACGPGEIARFTFTVIARGSGTLRYVWRPDKDLADLPARNETLTFTGPIQTENVVFTAPYNTDKAQQFGMQVAITEPAAFQGASYAGYDCQPSSPAP